MSEGISPPDGVALLSGSARSDAAPSSERIEIPSPPDAGKTSRSASIADDWTHKLKVYFPDRTYRNILCASRITVAEVKRKLLSRMQLPDNTTIQLLQAALDGSNFRVLFDSEFLQPEELRQDDAKSGASSEHERTSYISSISLSANDVEMVYLCKTLPMLKTGEPENEFSSTASGRGYLSRRKPSSDRHRRYFFQVWRVKKMLAMFKMKDQVHSVIVLNGSSVHAVPGNDIEFLLRIPGEGDYSFMADNRMERDDWMWVIGGVDFKYVALPGVVNVGLSRRKSVMSVLGKPSDQINSSPSSALLVSSHADKASAMIFEGVLFKSGLGIIGKSFFQPRRVRIHNGILMYYKTGQDNAHPSGVIILKHCNVSPFIRPGTSEPYGFIVNSVDRDYHFAAKDSAERDRWMTAILALCSTLSALTQETIHSVAFDLQPALQQVLSVTSIVASCLEFFKGRSTIDMDTLPWFADFSLHVTSVSEDAMKTMMTESNPVRLFLASRLRQAATSDNCHRAISMCLQQLIMPAILPQLLVQLGCSSLQPVIDHFAGRCRLVLQHPKFIESLNLPSRECSFEMGIKLMSKLPLLTDPHALMSSIIAVIESAQSDLAVIMGRRAPVLTGDHMFCLMLYFILKAAPAPHHFLSEVVSLLNSPFDLEGSRGYIAATYCAVVSYIMAFSASLIRKTEVAFVLSAKTLRHVPSKRFTKRLASVISRNTESYPEAAVQQQPLPELDASSSREAVLGAAEMDASSSDDDTAADQSQLTSA